MTTELTTTETGLVVREGLGGEIERQAETSGVALAAQAKAEIEARFVIAAKFPRRWQDIRVQINDLCRDPDFAAEALYVKPMSRTPDKWNAMSKRERLLNAPDAWPQGFSIRFVESALFHMGHHDSSATVIWEDELKRITQVRVLDFCTGSGYGRSVVAYKQIERKALKSGESAIDTRRNSRGEMVYVVEANEAEVTQKEAAAVSKSIRTLGERILPPHYKLEWRRILEKTIANKAAVDPQGEKKLLLDSYAELGILPSQLEAWLEHSLDTVVPAELVMLRKIYVAVANGEVTWPEVMESKFGPAEESKEAEMSPAAKKLRETLAKRKQAPGQAVSEAAREAAEQGGVLRETADGVKVELGARHAETES